MRQEHQAENERALLAGAKAFLDGEVGVIETVRTLSRLRDVRPDLRDSVTTFVGVDSETDAFPLGEVRNLWKPESIAKLDPEITKAADYYRARVRTACKRIVSVLG
jgi:hypothetical protein